MTEADWFDDRLHTFGMFVSGDPLRDPGPHGEVLRDTSFLMWFNAHGSAGKARLPVTGWMESAEVVLSTDTGHPLGERVAGGEVVEIEPRSMVVLRAVP
jgi:glycogen operon protein